MEILKRLAEAVVEGDDERAGGLTEAAVAQAIPALEILERGLLAGMSVVGEQFRRHDIFLPDVLMAAKAMTAGTKVIQPLLAAIGESRGAGRIVLGTVQGDLHDIGKNLAAIMLRGGGFEVLDLGKDVPAERFVDTAERESAEVIGMSALLTTTMPAMRQVIELVKARGLRNRVKTIVGGAPVTAAYASQIGADAYAADAASAVERVKEMLRSDRR